MYFREMVETKSAHSLLKFHQSFRGFLDRGYAIKPVDVEQINAIDTKVAQTLFADRSAVFRRAVDQHCNLAPVFDLGSQAELGSQENVLTSLRVQLEPLTDEHFVVSVSCGSIPERRA